MGLVNLWMIVLHEACLANVQCSGKGTHEYALEKLLHKLYARFSWRNVEREGEGLPQCVALLIAIPYSVCREC